MQIFGHDERTIKIISSTLSDSPFLKWKDCLNNKEYVSKISKYKNEWKAIQRLQGNVSHTSMHAGGVVIWNQLSDIVPVKCIHNLEGKRIKRVVCFDMDDLHEIGVYKFDILGLKTLKILDKALKNVKDIHDVDLDITKLNYEDKNVIDMIASGDVKGVFQIEEQAQRVMQQKPVNFRDLIAINAIIRPEHTRDLQ